MNPGHELDELIAKRVMDTQKMQINFVKSINANNKTVTVSTMIGYHPYSTDIQYAWRVVDAIRYNHGGGLLKLFRNGDDTYWASFDDEEKPGVTGETAPHAICLAALKAVGVNV